MTYWQAWVISGFWLILGIIALCAYFFFPDNRKEGLFALLVGCTFIPIGLGFVVAALMIP